MNDSNLCNADPDTTSLEQRKATSREQDVQSYHEYVDRITELAIQCLQQRVLFHEAFVHEPESIYIKSADRRIVYSNPAYMDIFPNVSHVIGLNGDGYLDESIAHPAKASDTMVLSGCQRVCFDHVGKDGRGRSILFRTEKRSLLGLGHPSVAIIGVSSILCVIEKPDPAMRMATLPDRWARFQKLDEQDKEIAILSSQGRNASEIACELAVSKRTVENRRNSIQSSLKVDSQVELAKLMVRLQDNGFGEFGV